MAGALGRADDATVWRISFERGNAPDNRSEINYNNNKIANISQIEGVLDHFTPGKFVLKVDIALDTSDPHVQWM